jgi:hypothetical protein
VCVEVTRKQGPCWEYIELTPVSIGSLSCTQEFRKALAAAASFDAVSEVPGVISGTEMPVMLSARSVVDPGTTRVTIEVQGDNTGADTLLLRRLRMLLTLAREQKHQQSLRVPGVTAGAEILLFLPCFFTLALWSVSSYS